jgi:signal transduction histidine kinase
VCVPVEASAATRHDLLLVRLLALTRVATLSLGATLLALHWDTNAAPAGTAALLGLIAAENACLLGSRSRRGNLVGRAAAAADVILGAVVLVLVTALLKHEANPFSDNALYPYSVVSLSVIGIAYRRLSASLLAAALASAAYVTATAWRFGMSVDVLANAATYWAWAVAGWFIADRFTALSRGLDEARQDAARREAELAAERERFGHARELHDLRMAAAARELEAGRLRARLSRELHDRLLQTLEALSRDGLVSDPEIRDYVAAEAGWLRDLVRGELGQVTGALAAALGDVVARQVRAGMRIELNTSGLDGESTGDNIARAVSGAVSELLTNVRKHAGTTRAVVRATTRDGTVTVTVLDRGRGFDPATATSGVGLRESVVSRIAEIGGHVAITSWPGSGTHVEITAPLPRSAGTRETAPEPAGTPA